MDLKPITLSSKDRLRQRAQWAFEQVVNELREDALAEAAYDLYRLYHEDLDAWAYLKGTLVTRMLTPQQLILVEQLFLASRVGSIEELAANVRDIPLRLQFSIRW